MDAERVSGELWSMRLLSDAFGVLMHSIDEYHEVGCLIRLFIWNPPRLRSG